MNRTTLLSLAVAGVLLLNGCAVLAPRYERPTPPVATTWPTGEAYPTVAAATPAPAVVWRDFILDDTLRRTVELALANNRDLKVAVLNVERFRAYYRIERAQSLPQLNASASASVQQVPATLSGTGSTEVRHQYGLGVGVSAYELDLFGRVASLKEQALEKYLASEEARRSAQLSLIAGVANAWLTLAADREGLELARQTLKSREESLVLLERRAAAGISSDLEVQQARTLVEAARVQSVRATRLVAQDENYLTLLVGAPLPAELLPQRLPDDATMLRALTPGLPSETLLGRPDILAAEHRLRAANANIGAARAACFPRIALTGSLGLGSDELSGLFQGGATAWSFVPQISVPIFDGGRSKAGVEVARVDEQIALAEYEKAIQSAFREVADALAERGTSTALLTAQQALNDATTESTRLSQARFDRGIDSYLNLLDAQRSLYGTQQALIAARLARLTNLVTLYKVLGGGGQE